ncbi:MAG: carbonic anhydrase [Planctomycetes bacterium]|nr:carbonic anhydrase [Planctomycetota bacterium]
MINHLIENNQKWASSVKADNPDFFSELAKGQSPEYLWIGCADSRIPACKILGLEPGELFVHRNIANIVNTNDLNALSVIQFAVKNLQVKNIILCGHYGCGGVQASMGPKCNGMIDDWLESVRDLYSSHSEELSEIKDPQEAANALSELNVKMQVENICKTEVVQEAWSTGQTLEVHGWVYDISTGTIKDLEVSRSKA